MESFARMSIFISRRVIFHLRNAKSPFPQIAPLYLLAHKLSQRIFKEKLTMCFPRNRYLALLMLIAVPFGWIAPFSTATASDFSGLYHLQDVVDGGDHVSATFVMQTFNNSSADVNNATVSIIEGPLLPVVTDLTYTALSIPAGNNSVLQGSITVPKELYNQWLSGIMPYALIQFVDASGNNLQYPIEVTGGGL